MSTAPSAPNVQQHIGALAIRYLAEHGYAQTTAGELADAIGMSRSTFFRRFGSKDDVIFIDHEAAFQTLATQLETTHNLTAVPEPHITETICRSITSVFDRLTRDPEAARMRSELLRETPALRDHELVLTNRYERLYVKYLQHALGSQALDWVAHALGASAVAIHNATLRAWLRHPDPRIIALLDSDLRALCQRFTPWLSDTSAVAEAHIVVTSYAPGTPTEHVYDALRQHLTHERPLATQ